MRTAAVDAFRGGAGLIRVVGHRGARGVLPENTLLGFEFAMATGAHLVEFDVVMTADKVPVITHNHRVHAPTFRDSAGQFLNFEPKIADLTLKQIQEFEIGRIDGSSPYGRRFPDQAQIDGLRVPRLRDLLELICVPRFAAAALMLEIKSDPDFAKDQDYRSALVGQVLKDVRETGTEDRVLLHSFDWSLLAECQRQAPDMPTSFLTELPDNEDEIGEDSAKDIVPDFSGREDQIPKLVVQSGGAMWCPYVNDITDHSFVHAKELGLVVAAWTVNEPDDIARMVAMGVDAIVTDYPGRVQQYLSSQGIAWTGAEGKAEVSAAASSKEAG